MRSGCRQQASCEEMLVVKKSALTGGRCRAGHCLRLEWCGPAWYNHACKRPRCVVGVVVSPCWQAVPVPHNTNSANSDISCLSGEGRSTIPSPPLTALACSGVPARPPNQPKFSSTVAHPTPAHDQADETPDQTAYLPHSIPSFDNTFTLIVLRMHA